MRKENILWQKILILILTLALVTILSACHSGPPVISGKVSGPDGPIKWATVDLNKYDNEEGEGGVDIATTITDENGYYVFTNLEPGWYGLYVTLHYGNHQVKGIFADIVYFDGNGEVTVNFTDS